MRGHPVILLWCFCCFCPRSIYHNSFHLSQGIFVNPKLSANCCDRACFQILLAPIRNGCSSSCSRVKPFSMRSAATTLYFTTSNCPQLFCELSVIHPSAMTKDSNHTGASASSARKFAGNCFPISWYSSTTAASAS